MNNSDIHELITERNDAMATLENLVKAVRATGPFSFVDYNEAYDQACDTINRYKERRHESK